MAKRTYTGKVVSDKMDKTVVVAITRLYMHPMYKKTLKKVTRLTAHDEENKSRAGDTVSIIETRPISKSKRWKVIEVLKSY